MKKEQNILTAIIILAVIALIIIIGSIIYEGRIESNKRMVESMTIPVVEPKNEEIVQNDTEEPVKEQEQEKEEYIGEEEQESQKEEPTTINKDEKAINLAKQEWGEDNTVTFNIEEKKGINYYIAVKREATVISWYEVNTETWEISEY